MIQLSPLNFASRATVRRNLKANSLIKISHTNPTSKSPEAQITAIKKALQEIRTGQSNLTDSRRNPLTIDRLAELTSAGLSYQF